MTDTTLVDVLNNTVNKLSNGIQALGNAVQHSAPDVWRVLIHRQKVLAVNDIIFGVVIISLICLLALFYKKFIFNKFEELIKKDDDFMIGQCICGAAFLVGAIVVFFVSVNHISDGLVRYNSAEYEAAKDALTFIKQ